MARNAPGQEYEIDFADDERERSDPRPMDWALLLLRAASRRKTLFAVVFVAGCAAVFGYYRMKAPVYRVEAKILAQRQSVLPNTLRAGPEDNPTRTAWELIHRRDNLVALVKAAKLLDPGSEGLVEELRASAGLDREQADPVDTMVTALDQRLKVNTEEGTISVSFDWHDPRQAYTVVEAALQNFIEARHVQEVTAIDEVLSVLRVRAANAKDRLARVTEEVRRESVEGYREAPAAAQVRSVKVASDELIRLKSLLEGKQRAIQDVEEFRRRRLADLHAQLDERRNTYSDAHPSVIQLRQDIESLSKESGQVSALRDEEAKLRKEYQSRLEKEGLTETSAGAVVTPPSLRPVARVRGTSTPVEEDERVQDARFEYQQIVGRLNAAELELDAVRAAFKFRYNVVWPPQVPRDPVSPNPVKIFGAGILAALFFALIAASAPDLRSGRIVERWQVERGLRLPVLAELNKK